MGTQIIIYKQGKIEYKLGGGLGSWAKETNFLSPKVKHGDTRVIKGVLMYAKYIYFVSGFKFEVNWCPVDQKFNNFENLKDWSLKYD